MENEEDENNEYLSSYNYYIYYYSMKPKDPRLPKPLYKPSPDLDFIKGNSQDKGEDRDSEISDQKSYLLNKDLITQFSSERYNDESRKTSSEQEVIIMMEKVRIKEESPDYSSKLTNYSSNENVINYIPPNSSSAFNYQQFYNFKPSPESINQQNPNQVEIDKNKNIPGQNPNYPSRIPYLR
jgi:hypothetical protein